MKTITAKVETKLKKRPVDSARLQSNEFVVVPTGKSYGVETTEVSENGHFKVTLAANSGTFYAFKKHWAGLDGGPQRITEEKAATIFGRSPTKFQLESLNACLNRYQINTPARMRHFLSQIAHESGGLQFFSEIWGPTSAQKGYENREDLGNTKPGDGYRFRGVGPIQVTGRYHYKKFSQEIGDPRVMEGCDYVAATYPFEIAGFWWSENDMNSLCDSGASVEQVTKCVNGGYNGLAERQAYYRKANQVIA